MKECDRLSVVTYDTNVTLDFPLTRMDAVNKEKTKLTVKAIRDGSSTNLCGGLLKGKNEESKMHSVIRLWALPFGILKY